MDKKTVVVLFGGCSTEYEVSLQSAACVIQSINADQYEIVLLGITREGVWKRYEGPVERISGDTWATDPSCVPAIISPDKATHGLLALEDGKAVMVRVDVVFPVLHGKNGEDGTLQGLLELAGIPCVGCGTLSSAICMDKDIAHRLVELDGIPVPQSVVIHSPIAADTLHSLTAHLCYPLFVKPACAGSSFGITRVSSADGLPDAVKTAFEHDRKVIIEQGVEGFEVGCSVLGNDDDLIIGEVDEIELSCGFFDYTEKYNLKSSRIHMPARIDQDTAMRIKQTAKIIYKTLGCRGFARVDMFLKPEGEIVFNEVNTIPGFTSHSRYPGMLKGIGMSFEGIVDTLISLAVDP
jgi:D-alanine---D-serine ligase